MKLKLTGDPVGPSIPGSPAMPCKPWINKKEKRQYILLKNYVLMFVYYSADYIHHYIVSNPYFTESFMVLIGYSTFNKPIFTRKNPSKECVL